MRKTLFEVWPRTRHPMLVRCIATLVIVALAFLVRMALAGPLAMYRLLLFIPAVFLSALLFGQAMGFLATALTTTLAVACFLAPEGAREVVPVEPLPLALYVAICVLMSAIIERLHQAMRQIADSEAEKTLLLQELNHRTRNDLMILSSALSLQARTMDDASAKCALQSAVGRISVVAKAQERLGTKAGHRGYVEVAGYLHALCEGLGELLRDIRPIALRVTSPRFELPSNQAATVGLIVNELVTNALKYAFPGNHGGVIDVSVQLAGDQLDLVVEDDGVGCPDGAAEGLGSRLTRLLAARHDGVMERVHVASGCRVHVILHGMDVRSAGAADGMPASTDREQARG